MSNATKDRELLNHGRCSQTTSTAVYSVVCGNGGLTSTEATVRRTGQLPMSALKLAALF